MILHTFVCVLMSCVSIICKQAHSGVIKYFCSGSYFSVIRLFRLLLWHFILVVVFVFTYMLCTGFWPTIQIGLDHQHEKSTNLGFSVLVCLFI